MTEQMLKLTGLSQVANRYKVRHALQAPIWLCGIVIPSCAYVLTHPNLSIIVTCSLVAAMFIVILTLIGGFIYLLLKDPNRLHSEEFLLESRQLDLIEQKGTLPTAAAESKLTSRPKRIIDKTGTPE
jgi:2C-methyl-D-erythritol 2,4-cyclodiphosphate synthase